MQPIASQELDKFELHLDEMVAKIQTCQKEKKLITCSSCNHYLDCELRTLYIKSVYNSMSKGETGGFEF
ncbi:MAG: hypothetical protein U9N33_03825 [Campylobacterota bacterium]|nr:hypothetical protein [Campylobacterota bacterium]